MRYDWPVKKVIIRSHRPQPLWTPHEISTYFSPLLIRVKHCLLQIRVKHCLYRLGLSTVSTD